MADEKKKSTATKLVEIAEELYAFGCVTSGRTNRPEDPEPIFHTYASPKNNPDLKRPLADIRADLAEVYQATHGTVPNATALGDAMTVLEGKARKATPVEADELTLGALLGGGVSSTATQLVELANERFTLGVTLTGEPYAEFGTEVLTLVRDGAITGLSVGFTEHTDRWSTDRRTVQRVRAHLDHVALVRVPAYPSARIAAVRAAHPLSQPLLRVARLRRP